MSLIIALSILISCSLGAMAPPKTASVPPPDADRIVGGKETTIEQYPWTVSVQLVGQHYCGGSIISSTRILTAGHCGNHKVVSYKIRAGSTNWQSGGQLVAISKIIVHPEFKSLDYDIAVMWLASELHIGSAGVSAIQLPQQDVEFDANVWTEVTGWGNEDDSSSGVSDLLRAVSVPLVSKYACRNIFGRFFTNNMICAGVSQGGQDACGKDSGGPMTVNGLLIGIVSWGKGCGTPGFPGVYTRVSAFRNWIDESV